MCMYVWKGVSAFSAFSAVSDMRSNAFIIFVCRNPDCYRTVVKFLKFPALISIINNENIYLI